MEIEKVKEIKRMLKYVIEQCSLLVGKDIVFAGINFVDILTLINELESENAELKKYRCDWLNSSKMHLKAEMEETEFELYCANKALKGVREENKQLKERIAELEEGIAKPMVGCEFLPECIKEKEVAIEIITKLEHLQRCIKSVSLNELIISLKKQYGGIK